MITQLLWLHAGFCSAQSRYNYVKFKNKIKLIKKNKLMIKKKKRLLSVLTWLESSPLCPFLWFKENKYTLQAFYFN